MKSNSYRLSKSNTKCFESQADNNKVIIKIPLDTEGFWEKEYNQNDLIKQIVQDFKSENLIDIPDDYFLDFYFQNKSLKMNDPIKTLLNNEIPTIYINQIVKKKPIKINIEPQALNFDLVGRPFFQPFEVFLFYKENKSLKIQLYDENTINELSLNEFCESSAYCNGNNHLFISGGEKLGGDYIDILCEIDLKEQIIAEPTKIIPKKNHSMIFIPNKYVFILGGNDKKCIYFDTETAEIEDWDDLNKIRYEPALLLDKNVLYCFDSVNYPYKEIFSIEKTDLDSLKPKWNLIIPKIDIPFDTNNKFLPQQSFGVSKDDEDNIIFIGGDMNNTYKDEEFNYKYNIKENIIEKSKIKFNNIKLKEKTFLPFKKNIDFILPNFERDNPEVIFFIKNKDKIETVNYKQKESPYKSKNPIPDIKYDFNMPKVAIPDPISSFNFEQDNFINMNNSSNSIRDMNGNNKINNIINFENKFENNNDIININKEDNLKNDINININNNKMISTFQEPEIEPAKEDLKLSLEFQNNNLLINNIKDSQINNKNEINGISLNLDNKKEEEIKNKEEINNEEFMNKKEEIKKDKNLKYDIKNIDLNKDIYITGVIKGNKSYKTNTKIKIKEKEIKNSNINLKNENKEQINNKSHNISKANNLKNLEKSNISPVNINTQKNIKINISKETKNNNLIDYNLSGNIPGIKKTINDKNNNNNLKENKNNEIFSMVGIIKGTGKKSNNKSKNINTKNSDEKNKNNNKKDIISGKNEQNENKKLSIPKLDLKGKIPEFGETNLSPNNAIINLKGDFNTPSYDLIKNSPTFPMQLNNNYKNENTIELNGDNNYSINNGNIKSSKIELSSFDNFQIEQKNLGQRKININNQDEFNIKANIPNKSINPKIEASIYNNNEEIKLKQIPGNQISINTFKNNTSINSSKIIYDSKNMIQNGISNSNLENNISLSSNNKFGINTKQYVKNINNNLPLVGVKNSNFVSSKVEPIKNTENININNIKSPNSSVNGIKFGKKIIE